MPPIIWHIKYSLPEGYLPFLLEEGTSLIVLFEGLRNGKHKEGIDIKCQFIFGRWIFSPNDQKYSGGLYISLLTSILILSR